MSDRLVVRLVHASAAARLHAVRPFRLECGYEGVRHGKLKGGMVCVDFNDEADLAEALARLAQLWSENRRRCASEAELPRILVAMH